MNTGQYKGVRSCLICQQFLQSHDLQESLVILAARLFSGLHPSQVDSFADQQLLGVPHAFWRQEARAAENPGVVDVEHMEIVLAGVDDRQSGVISGQNPVWAVGSNWE